SFDLSHNTLHRGVSGSRGLNIQFLAQVESGQTTLFQWNFEPITACFFNRDHWHSRHGHAACIHMLLRHDSDEWGPKLPLTVECLDVLILRISLPDPGQHLLLACLQGLERS